MLTHRSTAMDRWSLLSLGIAAFASAAAEALRRKVANLTGGMAG
jgi:hypothetical protein